MTMLPTRLMASLLYLKHTFALSDEDTVERWIENPYWQHFSGERYFRHELPCDPSSLVRWRQRIGEAGCERLLAQSIEAARRGRVIKRASLDTVVLDTTVQPKAIAHPTDSRLLNRAREQLVDAAQDAGITLRQSYARVGKVAEHQAGRYAHAKQYRRMQREIRKLRTWLGRVIRDVQRAGRRDHRRAEDQDRHRATPVRATPRLQEQAVRVARAGGGVHCQGQGQGALRVRREDLGGSDGQGGPGGGHALDAGQPLRRAHGGQPDRADRHPHGHDAQDGVGGPRLPRRSGQCGYAAAGQPHRGGCRRI
ncbi:MAG: transposase [Rubrivivax sp.]|nr:transposase [Rubrivivax sp.]